jgi:hypothetical protein
VAVVDRDRGNGLEMSLVRLVRGQRDSLSHATDSAGVATFAALDTGTYQLRVLHIGYPQFDGSVTLPVGCRRKVTVRLQQQRCDLAPDCAPPRHQVEVQACRPGA